MPDPLAPINVPPITSWRTTVVQPATQNPNPVLRTDTFIADPLTTQLELAERTLAQRPTTTTVAGGTPERSQAETDLEAAERALRNGTGGHGNDHTSHPGDGRNFMSLPTLLQLGGAGVGLYAVTSATAAGTTIAAEIAAGSRLASIGCRWAPVLAAGFATFDVCRDWYRFFNFTETGAAGSQARRTSTETRDKLRTGAIVNTVCTIGFAALFGYFSFGLGTWVGAAFGAGIGNIIGNLFKGNGSGVGRFITG